MLIDPHPHPHPHLPRPTRLPLTLDPHHANTHSQANPHLETNLLDQLPLLPPHHPLNPPLDLTQDRPRTHHQNLVYRVVQAVKLSQPDSHPVVVVLDPEMS